MSTIGFIGVGAMGGPMASNLLAAGHALRVFNRDRAKTRPFAEQGATVVESPAEAARGAEFVVAMVSDDDATRAVMLGDGGVFPAAAAGTIVADASTITPGTARALAQAGAERGIAYLDAPVTGSIPQARDRELVFMVGGDAAAFERAQPILLQMGKAARLIGGSGAGATLKLINNMLSGTLTAALAETAAVAEAAGIDPATVVEVLSEGAAGSRLVRNKMPKMFRRDFTPMFQLELMEKDLRYFLQLAQEVGVAASLASLAHDRFRAARDADLGKLDTAALILQTSRRR